MRIIDEVFKIFKEYGDDIQNLHIIPNSEAEIKLIKSLAKLFYNEYKLLLLKYVDTAQVLSKWRKLKPMKALEKNMIDELLELRKLNNKGFNKNAAIMNAEVEVNGKIMNLEYKALAGDGINGVGLCSNVNKDYVAKQLGISVDELMVHFKTVDEYNNAVARFHDSEHKIFSAFEEKLLKLKAEFGESAVKVKSMKIKTLYEPCNSCKKQIIIHNEMYDNAKVSVEATHIGNNNYAEGNKDLINFKIIK